jgi:hypothetical protein
MLPSCDAPYLDCAFGTWPPVQQVWRKGLEGTSPVVYQPTMRQYTAQACSGMHCFGGGRGAVVGVGWWTAEQSGKCGFLVCIVRAEWMRGPR